MGPAFAKLRVFFQNAFFISNTRLPPMHEMLYASYLEIFIETSYLFTHAVFQLVPIHKMISLECTLQGAKKNEVRGC